MHTAPTPAPINIVELAEGPGEVAPSFLGYLNTDEVRKGFLGGVSAQTVRNYIAKHGLPVHRVGRRHLFDPAEVDAWLRHRDEQNQVGDHRAAIKRLVDSAPELTSEQAERIRAVLTGGAA